MAQGFPIMYSLRLLVARWRRPTGPLVKAVGIAVGSFLAPNTTDPAIVERDLCAGSRRSSRGS